MGKPALDTYSKNIGKNNSGESLFNNSSSFLAVSPMVSSANEIVDSPTYSIDITGNSTPIRTSESIEESKVEITRLQYLRIRYQNKGFSEKVINLFISALDQNSTRMISSSLRTWIFWCESKSVDPVICDIKDICEFFADMVIKGLAYNTIAEYRSAISEIHEQVNGANVGMHPDISRTLHTIYVENPPQTHSDDPIDITPSLDYIRNLGQNDEMSIRDLSIKTSFLLALVTGSHPSDLKKINLTSRV